MFTLVDAVTRFCFLDTLVDKSCRSVATALFNFINTFGAPREIISDCGTEFVGKMFKEIVELYGVDQHHVLAYRPSSNGLVESKNKLVINIIRYFVQDDLSAWP